MGNLMSNMTKEERDAAWREMHGYPPKKKKQIINVTRKEKTDVDIANDTITPNMTKPVSPSKHCSPKHVPRDISLYDFLILCADITTSADHIRYMKAPFWLRETNYGFDIVPYEKTPKMLRDWDKCVNERIKNKQGE